MRYGLGKEDLKKIGKGLILAVLGAILTYISEVIVKVNFGVWTPIIVVFWSTIANISKKILDGEVK